MAIPMNGRLIELHGLSSNNCARPYKLKEGVRKT